MPLFYLLFYFLTMHDWPLKHRLLDTYDAVSVAEQGGSKRTIVDCMAAISRNLGDSDLRRTRRRTATRVEDGTASLSNNNNNNNRTHRAVVHLLHQERTIIVGSAQQQDNAQNDHSPLFYGDSTIVGIWSTSQHKKKEKRA
jgi:hypothetical protein